MFMLSGLLVEFEVFSEVLVFEEVKRMVFVLFLIDEYVLFVVIKLIELLYELVGVLSVSLVI